MATINICEYDKAGRVVLMNEMQPLDEGYIVTIGSPYYGHLVMRTASSKHFDVINLTDISPDSCWTNNCELMVRLLSPGEAVTIKLVGDAHE